MFMENAEIIQVFNQNFPRKLKSILQTVSKTLKRMITGECECNYNCNYNCRCKCSVCNSKLSF